ncbi:MAG TPA: AAA family ATPase [Stellaceae bacterium]|jgi:hypothetical protein|nr:AAA family ATPase [Stellaceae bacterium]
MDSDEGRVMDPAFIDEESEPVPPRPNGHDRGAQRFTFTRFRDIELGTAPAYTVHGIIPRLGVVIVWGKPKCGKTFWAFDLEMHVALGWPYRGREVEQGEVLHIACEGVAGLAARKEAWRIFHAAAVPDDPPFWLCKETSLDLIRDAEAVAKDIFAQFGDRPIRLITIDTLNRSLKGSESKDEDMSAYVRAAVRLAEQFQCAILIVHHCGYDATHPRGHTSLIGAVDADIAIAKDAGGIICAEVQNMRDGAAGAQAYSRLAVVEVGYDDNGDPILSCAIVPADPPAAQSNAKPKGTKPPSPMASKFFGALGDAIAAHGQKMPASAGRLALTKERWEAEAIRLGLLDQIPTDREKMRAAQNRRDAILSKYRRELIAANWLACNDKLLWFIRKENS